MLLERQKEALKASEDNRSQFRLELSRSLLWLDPMEQTSLRIWLKKKYWKRYKKIIKETMYPSFH